jgi:hypothetical protein
MQLKNLNFNKPKYTYLDPSKTQRVSNTALKTYQKNCLTSYFERQQKSAKLNGDGNNKSNPSLNTIDNEVTNPRHSSTNQENQIIIATVKNSMDIEAPPPPPRNRPVLRR